MLDKEKFQLKIKSFTNKINTVMNNKKKIIYSLFLYSYIDYLS